MEGLSDFNALVTEHVFELLLLMAEHLDLTLVELDVFIDSPDHFLHINTVRHMVTLTSSWDSLFFKDPVVPPRDWDE